MKKKYVGLRTIGVLLVALAIATLVSMPAFAADYNKIKAKKFGYEIKIPKDFERQGVIDKTTSWIRHKAAKSGKKKKRGLSARINLGRVSVGGSKSEEESGSGSSGEAALQIYVNWVYMADVSTQQLFDINKGSVQKDIDGPNSNYDELEVLDIEGGKAFWYKEVDKHGNDDIHRWHVQAFGNKSSYTIGLTGTFGQFEDWAETYEEVINSLKLVPIKE